MRLESISMNNNLDALLKTDDNVTTSLEKSTKYNNAQKTIIGICKTLSVETKDYVPTKTVDNILSYLEAKDKIERILYSEISSFIFAMESAEKGSFTTNVEKLMIYALNSGPEKISNDCSKIIVKIYDHVQLALIQTNNAKMVLGSGLEEAKHELYKEIKSIEKEHISILGIFAAIVLAFVGGITFSTSVLQNINNVSVFRLLIVVDLLALILVNVIWLLVSFVSEINDKRIKFFNIRMFNIACVALAIVVIIAWGLNVQAIANFLYKLLPWCK